MVSEKKLKKNCIRDASTTLLNGLKRQGFTNTLIGSFYYVSHCILMLVGVFIICFNINIIHLCCTLIIISLDAFSIVVLHGCPLTQLEQKYLNTNTSEERYNFFKKCGIVYSCQHEYDKQIELLVNVWLLIAIKCLVLIGLNTFHIKLHNTNEIYKLY
jgi:hypothetical protein